MASLLEDIGNGLSHLWDTTGDVLQTVQGAVTKYGLPAVQTAAATGGFPWAALLQAGLGMYNANQQKNTQEDLQNQQQAALQAIQGGNAAQLKYLYDAMQQQKEYGDKSLNFQQDMFNKALAASQLGNQQAQASQQQAQGMNLAGTLYQNQMGLDNQIKLAQMQQGLNQPAQLAQLSNLQALPQLQRLLGMTPYKMPTTLQAPNFNSLGRNVISDYFTTLQGITPFLTQMSQSNGVNPPATGQVTNPITGTVTGTGTGVNAPGQSDPSTGMGAVFGQTPWLYTVNGQTYSEFDPQAPARPAGQTYWIATPEGQAYAKAHPELMKPSTPPGVVTPPGSATQITMPNIPGIEKVWSKLTDIGKKNFVFMYGTANPTEAAKDMPFYLNNAEALNGINTIPRYGDTQFAGNSSSTISPISSTTSGQSFVDPVLPKVNANLIAAPVGTNAPVGSDQFGQSFVDPKNPVIPPPVDFSPAPAPVNQTPGNLAMPTQYAQKPNLAGVDEIWSLLTPVGQSAFLTKLAGLTPQQQASLIRRYSSAMGPTLPGILAAELNGSQTQGTPGTPTGETIDNTKIQGQAWDTKLPSTDLPDPITGQPITDSGTTTGTPGIDTTGTGVTQGSPGIVTKPNVDPTTGQIIPQAWDQGNKWTVPAQYVPGSPQWLARVKAEQDAAQAKIRTDAISSLPNVSTVTPSTNVSTGVPLEVDQAMMAKTPGELINASPIYQWQNKENEAAIRRMMAQRGLLNSSHTLSATQRSAEQLSAQEADKQVARLSQMYNSAIGQPINMPNPQSGVSLGNTGADSTALSSLYNQSAQNRANTMSNFGASFGSALNQYGQNLGLNTAGYGQALGANTGFLTGLQNTYATQNAQANNGINSSFNSSWQKPLTDFINGQFGGGTSPTASSFNFMKLFGG